MYRSYHGNTSSRNNSRRYDDRNVDEKFYENQRVDNFSQSPLRDEFYPSHYVPIIPENYEPLDTEAVLKLKWMDNSPRMSRLREHRHKRLINKLEQFELWDMEQEQKQKQYELAREQRYKNIVERLKSQEFCVNVMKKRHESDLETSRELEIYGNDHLYVDPLDDPKIKYSGPVTQYRKFQAEMDGKLQNLQHDMDSLNPRFRIEQAIIPRLERTRELYSVEPEVFTQKGKRVLKRPNLKSKISDDKDSYRTIQYDNHGIRFYYPPQITRVSKQSKAPKESSYSSSLNENEKTKLKPIIHTYQDESIKSLSKLKLNNNGNEKKVVNFSNDVEYSNGNGSSDKKSLQSAEKEKNIEEKLDNINNGDSLS